MGHCKRQGEFQNANLRTELKLFPYLGAKATSLVPQPEAKRKQWGFRIMGCIGGLFPYRFHATRQLKGQFTLRLGTTRHDIEDGIVACTEVRKHYAGLGDNRLHNDRSIKVDRDDSREALCEALELHK